MKSFSSRRESRYFNFAVNVMGIKHEGMSIGETIAAGIETFESFLAETGVPVSLAELNLGRGCYR